MSLNDFSRTGKTFKTKRQPFIKFDHSSIQHIVRMGLTDRQLQYCLAFYHCSKAQGFVLKKTKIVKSGGLYKGSSQKAVCWFRNVDFKIMKCLGVKRRQLQKIIKQLKKKKILVEQYTFAGDSELLFANIFAGRGKYTEVSIRGVYKKGFRAKAFIEQCIKEDLLSPAHFKDQMSFKMNERTARRHRAILERTKTAPRIPIRNKFLIKTTAQLNEFNKIDRARVRKFKDIYFYRGKAFKYGGEFSRESVEKAKATGKLVSKFWLVKVSFQSRRKLRLEAPGHIEGMKHNNSTMLEADLKAGGSLKVIKKTQQKGIYQNKKVSQAMSSFFNSERLEKLKRAENPPLSYSLRRLK